jgi:hypothetical protein
MPSKMDVFVVSRSRFERSDTLEDLGNSSKRARLVVPKGQLPQYKDLASRYDCELIGCPVDGIALTRQYCGKIADNDKFVMFDDDLRFYKRIHPEDWRLRYLPDLNLKASLMLLDIERTLDDYAHCSISAREGNNRLPYEGVECSRPLRVLAYRKDEFVDLEHGRVKIMEDFDVTLQLLRRGFPNMVIAKWAQGQKQTQMEGGCSDYRTLELHEKNVKIFAQLHDGYVKLRQKNNKSGGEFGVRLEATIYWQKAYKSYKLSPTTKGVKKPTIGSVLKDTGRLRRSLGR